MVCRSCSDQAANSSGADHLSLADRHQSETHRRSQNRNAFFRRLVAQRGKCRFLLAAPGLVDRITARMVIRAFEGSRQSEFQVLDEIVHPVAEHDRAPGRQPDGDGTMREREIIDVDPVEGHRTRMLRLAQQGFHRLLHPRPFRAGDEDVESGGVDFGSEPQRVAGTRLPDESIERREVRRRLKFQSAEIGPPVKAGRRQRHDRNHWSTFAVVRRYRHHLISPTAKSSRT